MLEFIALLRQRYQAVLLQLHDNSALAKTFGQRLEQLILSEAFIRKGHLLASQPNLPLQIAIIGPTQSGKSSLTNVILNSHVAGVSPLAGYTVHPHGFCVEVFLESCYGLQGYFGRYQQCHPDELSQYRYDCYGLAENSNLTSLLPPCVFWDTPDFDSINSNDYKEGVIRTIALADVIVLVVSKEKYADQSVWEMMTMIQAFKQPTLLCVNKLNLGDAQTIVHSLKEKWQQARTDAFPKVVPLFYERETGTPHWPKESANLFFQLAQAVDHRKHGQLQHTLLKSYWQQWIEPVLAEHKTQQEWQNLVNLSIEQALTEYQRDYLNHPRHYDTFQKTLLELLVLLEIPGLAKVLSKIRRMLTWPVRQVMQLGKAKSAGFYVSQELTLLNQIGASLLSNISQDLLEKSHSDRVQQKWWLDLNKLLRHQRGMILENFESESLHYYANFQHDVESSARRLYRKLEQQPLLLNSIRATRATTDAAAMALVVYAGGIGLADLLFTPVILSLTSLLAESAIGGYMNKVENELKQRQLLMVKQELFLKTIQPALYQLSSKVADESRFGISTEQLQAAQQQIESRYGLQLL